MNTLITDTSVYDISTDCRIELLVIHNVAVLTTFHPSTTYAFANTVCVFIAVGFLSVWDVSTSSSESSKTLKMVAVPSPETLATTVWVTGTWRFSKLNLKTRQFSAPYPLFTNLHDVAPPKIWVISLVVSHLLNKSPRCVGPIIQGRIQVRSPMLYFLKSCLTFKNRASYI